MARFVLMFHGGETPEEPSPEVMDRCMAWFGKLGDAVVDPGAPFGAAATIASDGTPSEGGGADPATGYTVIEAPNLHDAVVTDVRGSADLTQKTLFRLGVAGQLRTQHFERDARVGEGMTRDVHVPHRAVRERALDRVVADDLIQFRAGRHPPAV